MAWSAGGIASGSHDRTIKIWTANDRLLASGSDEHTIRLWDGSCQRMLSGDKQINCVAFSADGKILAASEGAMHDDVCPVRLYDTVTGDVKSTLSGHTRR